MEQEAHSAAVLEAYFHHGRKATIMKWRSIHLGSNQTAQNTYQQIVSHFKQLYQQANQPKGMALFQMIDSQGMLQAVYFTPEAVPHCGPLFQPPTVWEESDKPHDIGNLSWVCGDERRK